MQVHSSRTSLILPVFSMVTISITMKPKTILAAGRNCSLACKNSPKVAFQRSNGQGSKTTELQPVLIQSLFRAVYCEASYFHPLCESEIHQFLLRQADAQVSIASPSGPIRPVHP